MKDPEGPSLVGTIAPVLGAVILGVLLWLAYPLVIIVVAGILMLAITSVAYVRDLDDHECSKTMEHHRFRWW